MQTNEQYWRCTKVNGIFTLVLTEHKAEATSFNVVPLHASDANVYATKKYHLTFLDENKQNYVLSHLSEAKEYQNLSANDVTSMSIHALPATQKYTHGLTWYFTPVSDDVAAPKEEALETGDSCYIRAYNKWKGMDGTCTVMNGNQQSEDEEVKSSFGFELA